MQPSSKLAGHTKQISTLQPTILVIEDNPDDLRTLANFIGDMGKVLFAATGQQGLQMAQTNKPDLILLDIELPDILGPAVFKQIQEQSDTAVIFVTSHKGGIHQIAAMESGAVDFISKPYEPDQIRKSVHDQLHAQAQRRALVESCRDRITQAYNRKYFDQQLQKQWQSQMAKHATIAMALIQLDHFTLYNEAYGSLKSDACLKKVANALDVWITKSEDVLARFGHDKFAILINNPSREDMTRWGHEMVESVCNLAIPQGYSQSQPFVTASAGITFAKPNQVNSPASLVESAYEALSEARAAGHNDFAILSI